MRLEIHQINVSQGDATLIIHRDLPALRAKINLTMTAPTNSVDLLPFAIKNGIDLEGTVKYAVLVDAADGTYGYDVFEYMQRYGVKGKATQKNFYTVLTHYHSDHMGGINDVFNKRGPKYDIDKKDIEANYPPARAYDIGEDSKFDPDTAVFGSYLGELKEKVKFKIARKILKPGQAIDLGKGINNTQIQLLCLATNRNVLNFGLVPFKYKADQNARSLVLVLEYGPFRHFLGGDIGGDGDKVGGNLGKNADSRNKKGFQKLVSSHDDIETSIRTALETQYPKSGATPKGHVCSFKTNHHGSASSNDVFLLATMRPKIVLISSGAKDSFHSHPTQEVLNRLESGSWKNSAGKTITNSIENYYITEMAADNTKKKFKREFTNGRIIGDIIVRPFDNDIKDEGVNGLTMHVYGSGAPAALGAGFMALRPSITSDPLNPDATNGPWEHECDLH